MTGKGAVQFWISWGHRLAVAAMIMVSTPVSISWAGDLDKKIAEPRDGLLQNAEEMVAHGGMGDAKAILHHCSEAARAAESLIKQLPTSQPGREEGVASLNDVVRYCKKVSDIGVHADPGVLLAPAIKARAAARTAVKTLGLSK